MKPTDQKGNLSKDKPLQGSTMQVAVGHSGYKSGMIEIYLLEITFRFKNKRDKNLSYPDEVKVNLIG